MVALSPKIFIDSSILLAFLNRVDINHIKSSQLLEFLGQQKFRAFTSSLAVMNTFNRAEKDLASAVAFDFLQAILESEIQILYPEQGDFLAAYRLLRSSPNQQAGLTEIINARLMERHAISNTLTFDPWHNLMGTNVSGLLQS